MRRGTALALVTVALVAFASCGGKVDVDAGAHGAGTGGASAGSTGSTNATASSGGGGFGGAGFDATGGAAPSLPIVPDSGVVPADDAAACMARAPVCGPGQMPSDAKSELEVLIGQCGTELGCTSECYCGEIGVALDASGCATGIGMSAGGANAGLVACLAKAVDAVRWECAASTMVVAQHPCTTPI